MATGVLIVGIGRGTKHLSDFLGCTKTYDTVVLFGKGTDTYDVAGRIVSEAPYGHITNESIEKNLARFRGKIKQVPPVYSALKIEGMKAYEYARSGQELPRELESREMMVDECTSLDWQEGGKHDFRWPAVEASEDEKAVARKLMKGAEASALTADQPDNKDAHHWEASPLSKEASTPGKLSRPNSPSRAEMNKLSPAEKTALHTHEQNLADTPADGPAATIRLTVSSGFYVRSFAHDLGVTCRSQGTMAALLRSRQGDYTCIDPAPDGLIPCLTYDELEKGEEVWGPKLQKVLQDWLQRNPPTSNAPKIDDRDRPMDPRDFHGYRKGGQFRRQGKNQESRNSSQSFRGSRKRNYYDRDTTRNSSSPE